MSIFGGWGGARSSNKSWATDSGEEEGWINYMNTLFGFGK